MPPLKGDLPTISPRVLHVITRVVEARLPGEQKTIACAVAKLSRLFTKDRPCLPSRYLDEAVHASAYLSYFLPVNLAKVQALLDELPTQQREWEEPSGLRVLDLGSGPGTGSLAVLDWLSRRDPASAQRLSVVAVDSSAAALQRARDLWECYCREAGTQGARLATCEGNLEQSRAAWHESVGASPYDLIILANCVNELWRDAADCIASRARFITTLLDWLALRGTVMIVEPALRETSRALHSVRDRLLQEQRCTVYGPCLHGESCPALIDPDDWCHEERRWAAPASIQEIDREAGFIKDALKFSYLLLRKDGLSVGPRNPATVRIVSELRELKGDTRAWVCNELGRFEIGRLDRAESGSNAPWSQCQRGTIVKIQGLKRRDGAALVRIPPEGTVEIVRKP
ncbi:MAG TPA: small ribosomal subunit Rsm22 family protein [Nitrospira sp.]|nr:small ribosomal subunit Rsm22 family protein [Nitrospira sp.]